jgi:hypothetical protein
MRLRAKTKSERKHMKPKLIFKSLTELPASGLAPAASTPVRGENMSKQIAGPPARSTPHQIRVAHWQTQRFVAEIRARFAAPFRQAQSWQRGGLND